MNEKTKSQFRELYKLLMEIEDKLKNIPMGELNPEQREYLGNAKVLNTISKNALVRISNVEKGLSNDN